jgi:hypothetical protein
MKMTNDEKMERLFLGEQSGSENITNEDENPTCLKCCKVLISAADVKDLILYKRQQWINEGHWDNSFLHICNTRIDCECGAHNFYIFIVRQYTNQEGIKRFSYGAVGFKSEERLREFTNTFFGRSHQQN